MDNKLDFRHISLSGGARLLVVTIVGALAEGSFIESLQKNIEQNLRTGVKGIILDCASLNFLNSTGISSLIYLRETVHDAAGHLWLASVKPAIQEVLRSASMLQFFQIADHYEQAQNEFNDLITAHTTSMPSKLLDRHTEGGEDPNRVSRLRSTWTEDSQPSQVTVTESDELRSAEDSQIASLADSEIMEDPQSDENTEAIAVSESAANIPTPDMLDTMQTTEEVDTSSMIPALSSEIWPTRPSAEDNEINVEKAIQQASEASNTFIDVDHPILIQLGANMQVFHTYPLHTKVMIGRHNNNHIQVIDTVASKNHLQIFPVSEGKGKDAKIIWKLHDLDSTNGTYLNGKRISTIAILNDRDLIQLGRTVFIFSWEAQSNLFTPQSTCRTVQQLDFAKPYETMVKTSLTSIEHEVQELRQTLQRFSEFEKSLDQEQDSDAMLQVFYQHLRRFLENKVTQCVFLKYECTDQEQRYLPWQKPEKTLRISKNLLDQLRQQAILPMTQCFLLQDSAALEQTLVFHCPDSKDLPFPFIFFCLEIKEQKNVTNAEMQRIGAMLEIFINHIKYSEQSRRKNEIESARYLQQKIIPLPNFLHNTKVSVLRGYGVYQSALELGGDYYDHTPFGRYHYIFVGDVAGKGVDAAMVSTSIKAYLTAILAAQAVVLPRIALGLDRFLSTTFPAKQKSRLFTTMLLLRWNSMTNAIEWINAGHNAPLLCNQDNGHWNIKELATDNSQALGLTINDSSHKPDWEVQKCTLAANEFLLLYSDGITEAMSPRNIPFGMNGLQNSIQSLPDSISLTDDNALEEIARAILKKVDQHRNGRSQFDDLTMVLLQTKKLARESSLEK